MLTRRVQFPPSLWVCRPPPAWSLVLVAGCLCQAASGWSRCTRGCCRSNRGSWVRAAPLACQSRTSRIQLEKKRGRGETDRETEGGGVGRESRGHVNRYMLETHSVFIHAVIMQRGDGRGIWSVTIPECWVAHHHNHNAIWIWLTVISALFENCFSLNHIRKKSEERWAKFSIEK